MAQRIDYSVQLPDIDAPKQSKAGDILVQAGASQGEAAVSKGKASATGDQATAGLIGFLGTTALEASKGYMEAGLRKDIDESLKKLEGVGETAVASQANLDRLRSSEFASGIAGQLTVLREQSGGLDDEVIVKDFMQDIQRYADAQKQGIMSRAEVVARVGAAVKQASVTMPGWAAEFRKIGAEKTGISNVDIYGIHTALTTKSLAEKAAERRMEIQMQLDKEIATKMGVALDQISPPMRAAYYQHQQLSVAAQNAESKMKLTNLGQDEADKAWGQIVGMEIGAAVADLSMDFATLGALNQNPASVIESKEFGLKLSGKLALQMNTLEQNIRAKTRPVPGQTALSVKEADRLIGELRQVYKGYEEAVKNIEGRNMFAASVKAAGDKVDLLMNNLMLAHPHVAVLNKIGVTSELFKAWVSLGNEPEFEKRFGKELTNAMKAIMKNPAAHANVFGAIATGQPVALSQVHNVDPNLSAVVMSDLVTSIKEWNNDPAPTPERLTAYSNVFATAAKSLNMNMPRDLATGYGLLTSPETQAFMQRLTPEQRANAVLPMVANVESTTKRVMGQIQSEVAAFNDTDTNPAARAGWRLEFGRNNLTGAFEVQVKRGEAPTTVSGGLPGGLAFRVEGGGTNLPTGVGASAAAAQKRANDLTANLNRMLEVYTVGSQILAPDKKVNIAAVRDAAMMEEPLSVALGLRGAGVPRNDETGDPIPMDKERVLDAIVKAEASGDAAVSPKGARGRFQFMPETAKQYGLKVDPQSGIDERTDPAKSRVAAGKYIDFLAKTFKGDLEKVAAAYNAGEGNVKKAVEKATQLGVASMWQAFLPKPSETVPYIKRFMTSHGAQ